MNKKGYGVDTHALRAASRGPLADLADDRRSTTYKLREMSGECYQGMISGAGPSAAGFKQAIDDVLEALEASNKDIVDTVERLQVKVAGAANLYDDIELDGASDLGSVQRRLGG